MKRIAAIFLLIAFVGLGTGALQYLHELQHAAEDAREDALAKASGAPKEEHHHDESNCQVCAQLHMALMLISWVPLLIFLGLFAAFLTLLDSPLIPRSIPARLQCRGPPLAISF